MSSEAVGAEPAEDEALREVVLVGYPLQLGLRASEHYEAVFREFALLAASEQSGAGSVPDRMVALIDALGRRYARNNDQEQQREDAISRGESTMDLILQVPESVAEVSLTLDRMLDETDEYCRDGMLLTLQADDDVVAFRRWYLREVIDQIAGHPARPWSGGGH
jgi:hypothetical protein